MNTGTIASATYLIGILYAEAANIIANRKMAAMIASTFEKV